MRRRTFLKAGLQAAGLTALPSLAGASSRRGPASWGAPGEPFQLDYAPHFGMFCHHAGEDVLGQLRFMADEGFRALEDNWMARRAVAEQEAIAREMEALDMRMGVFVAHAGFGEATFASDAK
jgi:hydroxypyruvate isomerase